MRFILRQTTIIHASASTLNNFQIFAFHFVTDIHPPDHNRTTRWRGLFLSLTAELRTTLFYEFYQLKLEYISDPISY